MDPKGFKKGPKRGRKGAKTRPERGQNEDSKTQKGSKMPGLKTVSESKLREVTITIFKNSLCYFVCFYLLSDKKEEKWW